MFKHKVIQSLGAAVLTLGLGTLSSCNLLYDFEQPQCEKDRDCAERGGEYATAQCVDGYCEAVCEEDSECEPDFACEASQCTSRWECPAQQADSSSAMLHLNTVVTSITGDPLPGIEVLLCANVDPDCEAPTARLQTDQSGGLEFEVTPNFGGYLQTALPGFFPQLPTGDPGAGDGAPAHHAFAGAEHRGVGQLCRRSPGC